MAGQRFSVIVPFPSMHRLVLRRLLRLRALDRIEDAMPRRGTLPVVVFWQLIGPRHGLEATAHRAGLVPLISPVSMSTAINSLSLETIMFMCNGESAMPGAQFRSAIRGSGFYQWMKLEDGAKQPHLIQMRDGSPFSFAGLWKRWDKGEAPIEATADRGAVLRRLRHNAPRQ